MAQLGARLNGIEEAEGSNPSGSTKSDGRSNMLSARKPGNFDEIQALCKRSTKSGTRLLDQHGCAERVKKQKTLSGKARYSSLRWPINGQPGWYRGETFVPDDGGTFYIKEDICQRKLKNTYHQR